MYPQTMGGPDVVMEVYAAIEQRLSETAAVLYSGPHAASQQMGAQQQPQNSSSQEFR